MNKQYTKSFKIEAVKKVLSRNFNTSVKEVADSLGVKLSTLYGWVKAVENNKLEKNLNQNLKEGEKRPKDWMLSERLQAIIETERLDSEQRSAFCREKGIFPHHLESWKKEFISSTRDSDEKLKNELKKLKDKNNELQKELSRKEKALAETAALLVLKKKAEKIWKIIEEEG